MNTHSPTAPAFPVMLPVPVGQGYTRDTQFPGLSRLAYVAAGCLQGMLANPEFEPARYPGEETPDAYARRAVDYAEALLARLATVAEKGGAL